MGFTIFTSSPSHLLSTMQQLLLWPVSEIWRLRRVSWSPELPHPRTGSLNSLSGSASRPCQPTTGDATVLHSSQVDKSYLDRIIHGISQYC